MTFAEHKADIISRLRDYKPYNTNAEQYHFWMGYIACLFKLKIIDNEQWWDLKAAIMSETMQPMPATPPVHQIRLPCD